MNFRTFTFLLITLGICYLAIGIYSIERYGITVDEPAHIAGIQGYTDGYGFNVEQTLAQKLACSIYYKFKYGSYQFKSNERWMYERGVELLTDPNLVGLLRGCRYVMLISNMLIFLWLWLYTIHFNFLSKLFSISFASLLVFSPSFSSFNYIISFDVGGSCGLCMFFIASLCVLHHLKEFISDQLEKPGQAFLLHPWCLKFLLMQLMFTLCLHLKFSNVLLSLPYLLTCLYIIVCCIRMHSWRALKQSCLLMGLGIFFSLLLTYVIYAWAFRESSNLELFERGYKENWYPIQVYRSFHAWLQDLSPWLHNAFLPFSRYAEGMLATGSRASDKVDGFLFGKYRDIDAGTYSLALFWFKESISFLIIWLLSTIYSIRLLVLEKHKLLKWLKANWATVAIMGVFPVIYMIKCFDTYLIMGYRYFYPMLILIYMGVAFCISHWYARNRINSEQSRPILFKTRLLVILLCVHGTTGFLAADQGMSFINSLWLGEKWKSCGLTSLNLCQEHAGAFEFLQNQNAICENGVNQVDIKIFKVGVTHAQHYEIATGEKALCLNSYPKNVKYIVIDSYMKQAFLEQYDVSEIARGNIDFLEKTSPVYNGNDIIWVYKLR